MHILKIIHGYPTNYNAGSEVYTQSICNELSKLHKVSIFTREENPYSPDFGIRKESLSPTLDIYYVNNPQGKDGYRHKKLDENFAKLIQELKLDIAHIGHLNHLSTGIVDELNKNYIPIVFTLHDFWLMCPRGQFLTRSIGQENNFQLCSGQDDNKCAIDCYSVYFSGKESEERNDIQQWSNWTHQRMVETKSIIDKVNLFIAPSHYLRNRFISGFSIPDNKIVYLDYGFPTEYLTQTEKSKEKKNFSFGYIGTHIPAKGINQLIEAFKQIQEPATLKIYGRPNGQSTDALKKIAQSCKNPIEFSGEYVNHNLPNEVFSKVDCIVVPSIWAENSPLVLHEAQACKVPVITANFGGMKEYVQHKVNGLLFEHRDTNSLAEQMMFAVKNPDLLKHFGEKGYLFSENGKVPNIKDHCIELVEIYKTLIVPKNLWRITLDTNPEDCNLNCIMCEEHSPYSDFIPTLFKETGVKRRRMQFRIVEDIFLQAEKLGIKEIIPSTMGEPLLYKEFDKIFDLAKKHKIKINLTTNGTFPKKTVLDWAKLIVPNTTDVKISWNGATKETAEKVMLGIDFEKAISNVKEFIRYRNEYFANNGYFCRVTFQLTFMQNNMHELADIIKLAAELGVDRVKGHQLWAHFDEIKQLSMKATVASIDNWNLFVKEAYETQEKFRKPNGEKVILENIIPITDRENKELPYDYECPFLNKELWISATGKISPCCAPDNLRKSLGDFGNINDTSIEKVLQSPIYKELVKNYKSKPLCKTCNMRKPFRDFLWNFRDISTHNSKIKCGRIYRTSTMTLFQNENLFDELLREKNIKTVIDLRADKEIEELPYTEHNLSKFKYVKAQLDPWNQPDWFIQNHHHGTNEEIAYRFFTIGCNDKIKHAIEAILNEDTGSVAIHCFAGKDRTGVFISMLHLLANAPIEYIQKDYLASEADTSLIRLNLVLDIINEKGGIEPYLTSCGLSENQISKLKQKLLN